MSTIDAETTLHNRPKTILRLLIILFITLSISETPHFYELLTSKAEINNMDIAELCLKFILLFFAMYFFVIRSIRIEVTKRINIEKILLEIELNNQALIEALPDTFFRVSHDGTLLDCKIRHPGFTHFETGKKISDVLPPEIASKMTEQIRIALAMGEVQKYDFQLKCDDNDAIMECRLAPSGIKAVLAIIRDISERKYFEDNLKYLSNHDSLTGLFNRTLFEEEIENLSNGRHFPVSIIMVDIDGLKETNDTYGHSAGDTLICKMSSILKRAFRAEDIVARIGGDEFVVLLPDTDISLLQNTVNRINVCLENANRKDGGPFLKFSLGAATAESKNDLHDALKLADERMYQNKLTHKQAEAE